MNLVHYVCQIIFINYDFNYLLNSFISNILYIWFTRSTISIINRVKYHKDDYFKNKSSNKYKAIPSLYLGIELSRLRILNHNKI